jgi:hypothetical protein
MRIGSVEALGFTSDIWQDSLMEEKWLYLTVTNIHLLPFNPTYALAKGPIPQ